MSDWEDRSPVICFEEYEKEVQKLKRQFQAQQAPFIEARDKVRRVLVDI